MSQKATGQGAKIWPDTSPPEGFMRGYANPPEPGKERGGLGRADPRAVEHALKEGSGRITKINEGTRAGVRKRIQEAIDQGMSPAEAGEYVRQWTGFDQYRAERIARTEMMFSYNAAATRTYAELGVTHVMADDGDEDEECAARHGQIFTVEEAAGIEDHPNGTLDWLPIEPTGTTSSLRGELNQLRPIRGAEAPEPPRPPRPEPPPPPPPPVEVPISIPGQVAQGQIETFQQQSTAAAHRLHDVTNGATWGGSKEAIVAHDGSGFRVIPTLTSQDRASLRPGTTFLRMDPIDGRAALGTDDVQLALETGANVRRFNVDGAWVEIRPRGVQGVLSQDEVATITNEMLEAVDRGAGFNDAWEMAAKRVLGNRAELSHGRFEVEAIRAKQLAKEAAERAEREAAEQRAQRMAGSRLGKMPRAEVEQGIRSGKIKLDDVAAERWGWKGGTPGSPDAGKYVVRAGARTKNNPWTIEHEVQFFRAYEDVAERTGGYGRMRIDVVRFSAKDSSSAAADYGAAGVHRGSVAEGGRVIQTNRVQFYKNSAREMGKSTREYGTGADDFYSTAVHELGHAWDYGSVSDRAAWDALQRAAKTHGRGPVHILESQVKTSIQRQGYIQRQVADIEAELASPNPSGFYPGRQWLVRGDMTYRKPDYYTVETWKERLGLELAERKEQLRALDDQLKRLQGELADANVQWAKTLSQADRDYLMTDYSSKNGREAFAEAMVFYVTDPDKLKARAPLMFRFLEDAIKGGTTYR